MAAWDPWPGSGDEAISPAEVRDNVKFADDYDHEITFLCSSKQADAFGDNPDTPLAGDSEKAEHKQEWPFCGQIDETSLKNDLEVYSDPSRRVPKNWKPPMIS
jgi:hypothetical protein